MAQPVPFTRGYNFTGFSTANPASQQPGVKLDIEFDALKATTDQVLANLALIQRDDGKLANGSVVAESLASSALSAIFSAAIAAGLPIYVGPPGPAGAAGDLTLRLESYGAVGDANPTTGAGTDDTAALNAALAALNAAGGGTIKLGRKCYKIIGDITLPNRGDPNVNGVPNQYPYRITGLGYQMQSEGNIVPTGGSIRARLD